MTNIITPTFGTRRRNPVFLPISPAVIIDFAEWGKRVTELKKQEAKKAADKARRQKVHQDLQFAMINKLAQDLNVTVTWS